MQTLPPKPQPPVDYDCCGGGCADCDLRRYQQALIQWQWLAENHIARPVEPGPKATP